MFLEKIKTPGLSHLSYIIGSGGKAAVIDPRRDCEVYVEKARAEGLEITHIFETHRNEDLLSGSPILASCVRTYSSSAISSSCTLPQMATNIRTA